MRLYNGCPDSELKAKWDNEEKAIKKMNKLNPEAHCTYFPMECKYSVWANNKQITQMWNERINAIEEAIKTLSKEKIQ